MSMFKCKMCGGTLEIQQGMTVAECEYCGTKQTLPRLDDDKKTNLYDRANHFRRNGEFDKAMAIYEQILNEDNTDAEAYWSLVLGRYGIEYVEDPVTHRRIPTVNRTQLTSIFADEDYKAALQYADGYQRRVYEAEAKEIDDIQKGILDISRQEEPFDVFICYKEKDQAGGRTQDSVLANDLYYELTEAGFKVFFARITLENKLGSAYEPYIFAALNSAKVMVVLGTKPEYFKAVWVKNEWFRYLSLIRNGAKKVLIPAYKDMDPYDLPEEFSHLQSQDMSQLGFLQDLIRGIKKILNAGPAGERETTQPLSASETPQTAPLLKRVFLFLEDGEWSSADEYCEKVLDLDPENAQAYLGKLMAELRISKQERLADCDQPFDNDNNYKKILRFADQQLKQTVQGYLSDINQRNENQRLQNVYQNGISKMDSASKEEEYLEAAQIFQSISGYENASALADECISKAEVIQKDRDYQCGCVKIEEYYALVHKNGYSCDDDQPFILVEAAMEAFQNCFDWKDAAEKITLCQSEIQIIKRKQQEDRMEQERREQERKLKEKRRAKRGKLLKLSIAAFFLAVAAYTIFYSSRIVPGQKYQQAMKAVESKDYEAAVDLLEQAGTYQDSKEQLELAIQKLENLRRKKIKKAKSGDTVYFGRYPEEVLKGHEMVEWIVLDKKKNKLLLLSKHCPGEELFDVTMDNEGVWENSSIRNWLNSEFLTETFADDERKAISKSKIKNYSLDDSGKEIDNSSTKDSVFFLSVEEVKRYFPEETDRKASRIKPRASAVETGGFCEWMLRTGYETSYDNDRVVYVDKHGIIKMRGSWVSNFDYFRPALWVDVKKLK